MGTMSEGLYGALIVLPYKEIHASLYDYHPPDVNNVQLPQYERVFMMQVSQIRKRKKEL